MKTKMYTLLMLCSCHILLWAQNSQLPDARLTTLDGIPVQSSHIDNNQMPLLMVFWKTYDNECCEQLLLMNDAYENFLKVRGVKLVSVCIDCIGKTDHIKPFLTGNALSMEAYIDVNGDFKRKMGIPQAPFTILFDHEYNIVCQHAGYCSGADDILCEKVDHCLQLIEKTD